jgi:hypothetical protein
LDLPEFNELVDSEINLFFLFKRVSHVLAYFDYLFLIPGCGKAVLQDLVNSNELLEFLAGPYVDMCVSFIFHLIKKF